ncbi:MAG: hypothetical protein J7L19_05295 [Dehalococcoidia bacterium]|nr:hypothetical protein [Dehalococcoidia bacterium]
MPGSTCHCEEIVSNREPTWSPFKALWDYAIEPTIFEDGEYRKYPIFAKFENYTFPDPAGTAPIVYHQHQEQISLPHVIGKGIKYCDFKYPVGTLASAFIKMGLQARKGWNYIENLEPPCWVLLYLQL